MAYSTRDRRIDTLGINGFGRIGKLLLWHLVGRKACTEIVVNIGRRAGTCLTDIAHYTQRDTTYGRMNAFLFGYDAGEIIHDINEADGTMIINGTLVRFLRTTRNPSEIAWHRHGVRLVVDTTGKFLDPTAPEDAPGGSIRGHFAAGASKVVVSAPFKMKDNGPPMPEDSLTTVMGINDSAFDPRKHRIISNASCTTTCLAHMVKPLIDAFGPKKILSASMATVHAATGSQQVLDRLPREGKTDLRKNRSIMNNIILTSTGAARALQLVIPEMSRIGFIAESVRVPIASGSLIILVVNLQESLSGPPVTRDTINDVYRKAAETDPRGYLHFSERQNVSRDIVGVPRAAAIIEGHETHRRTAEISIDLDNIPGIERCLDMNVFKEKTLRIPVTQAVIYGWYDNEMGSYVNMLGDRTVSIAESMV